MFEHDMKIRVIWIFRENILLCKCGNIIMIVLYTILITDEYRNIALTSISPDTFCTCVRNHVEILTWMKLENLMSYWPFLVPRPIFMKW